MLDRSITANLRLCLQFTLSHGWYLTQVLWGHLFLLIGCFRSMGAQIILHSARIIVQHSLMSVSTYDRNEKDREGVDIAQFVEQPRGYPKTCSSSLAFSRIHDFDHDVCWWHPRCVSCTRTCKLTTGNVGIERQYLDFYLFIRVTDVLHWIPILRI